MIDNLLDGLKEGRIKAAEFGQGVDKAMKETLEGTNISAEQLQKWGQSVSKGGKEGSAAMTEIAAALANVEDQTKRNELGVKLFGTMYEDQGDNITYALLGAQSKVVDFDKNQTNLNESIKKMDADPAVKMQKTMGDLKMALEPVLSVVADLVSKFAEWVTNNPALAATLAAVATAIGIISGAIMALAPIVVTVMSIFGIGAAAAAGIVAIVPIIIAAIVALGFAIYKNWEDIKNWTIDTYNFIKDYLVGLWSGIVETASSWLSLLVESVSGWWSSLVESTITWLSSMVETASSWWSSLVETASQFFMQLFQKWQETWQSILTFLDPIISLISTLLEAGWLLIQAGAQIAWAAISQYIIQPILEAYNWVSVKIGELVAWLGTQWELAKSYTLVGWNLIKQYVIQPVQELWNTTKQKLSDLANWILGNWAKIQSYTLAAWQLVYKYVIDPVISAYNSTKEKFGEMYNSAKEKFDAIKNAAQEKFDAAKRNIIDPIKDAVGKVEEFIGKIKGFFSDLKLKIPKPEMPPLPHFSLQTSTKNVLGKDVTYPSGINIDWRAKGGIFTKPTIFGMNGGNLQGAGEAGREAVLPLNKKTLGDIGAGIVAAMPRQQFAMPGEINQLMGDMSRMMASSVSQLSALKTVMSGVYGNMSNSKQAMTSSVSNQVINNSFGSSGGGAIPMLGGDLVVEVPVVIEGRDVARGTYRYTTEYQEREKQRDSAF
ncbi:phage tail tape measure protein [Bacillus toyonensis]|uniref:phage tail tape measure protein n=1 Tax=Bacillus toyonensis TaxID=155322 RepID=UPI000BF14D2F|nr:phage tail tape measure protein [Bacillus toyonensis]PEM52307.1 phage tail tape measure protein [Bacillus toyonensis]